MGEGAERIALAAEGGERIDREAEQLGGKGARAGDPQELDESDFRHVLADVLAGGVRGAEDVQEVVGDLEGEAQVLGVAGDQLEDRAAARRRPSPPARRRP